MANVGNIDNLLARTAINVPLVNDRLAARITVMGLIRSGYGTDIGSENKVYSLGRSRQLEGRVQLRWAATDNLEFLLAGDIMRTRGHSLPGGLTPFNSTEQTDAYNLTAPVKIGPQWLVQGYDSFLYIKPDDDVDAGRASLTATWTRGDLTIKSISAYRKLTAVTAQDFGGVPLPWIAQQMDQSQWQVSQELQASGSLFDDKLKYTGGVYYFQERSHNDTTAGLMGSLLLIPDTNTAKSYSA
jgi:iron complex outermembrane receptor protein